MARIGSTLRRVIKCDFRFHEFLAQDLSIRQVQLIQQRTLHHLISMEHSSVIKSLQTRLPCALVKLLSSNILHPSCYHLVHGLSESGSSDPTMKHTSAPPPTRFRCTNTYFGNHVLANWPPACSHVSLPHRRACHLYHRNWHVLTAVSNSSTDYIRTVRVG